MKTYVISTEYTLSEFHAGMMAGIIQAIAGNCDARAVTGYMIEAAKDKDKNHNLFVFKASKEGKDKILKIAKPVFGEYCYEISEVGGEKMSEQNHYIQRWKWFKMNEQIKSDPTAISVEGRVNDSMVLQEILKNDE